MASLYCPRIGTKSGRSAKSEAGYKTRFQGAARQTGYVTCGSLIPLPGELEGGAGEGAGLAGRAPDTPLSSG